MDLLRNLGSAAATSLLQKSGISLPYSLGEKVHDYDGKSIWTLYDATKKDDSSPVSVFHFDASGNRRTHLPFARNALKKLRTTRHPDILKFIDVVEQGESMWIMTERVRPLRPVLFSWVSSTGSAKGKDKEREGWTIWGLHRIAIALAFLNSTGASTHGNVSIDSIFLSPSGEWRLGGLELLSSTKDENPVLFTLGSQFPRNQDISSPEVKKNGWNAIKELDPGISDAYALGLLLNSAFNQTNELPATAHPPHPAPTGASRGQIPPGIFPLYKRLLNPGTKQRLTCQAFLEIGMGEKAGVDGAPGRFFADNHLVRVCSQLEGYPLASDGEKAEFIRDLRDSAGSFPPEFAINRLIPAMFSGLSHGGANAEMVISLVLEFGKLADPNEVGTTTTSASRSTYKLDQNQYNQIILTPLVKLFTSTDRATRMALLKNMPQFAPKLEAKVVQDGVWPHLQTGLSDTVAAIREATLIAINEIPNKLSSRVLNNDLLRHLARLQSDPEPSIRTNTCIMIAKLAPLLSESTQKKVLVPAFSKALKDPFVHARIAALQGFTSCVDCFDMEDAATKVIGVIASGLVDKEKVVRDPAFKCFDTYRQRIEKYAASLPETAIPQGGVPPGALPATGISSSDILSTATGMAGGVAGWAFESLSSRLVPKDLNSKMATPPPPSTGSVPTTSMSTPATPSSSVVPSVKPTPNRAPPVRQTAKPKGMALGSKLGAKGGHAALMAELEKEMNEDAADIAEAWDDNDEQVAPNGDLMDVHADQDDWSAFESAPTPVVTVSTSGVSGLASSNPWKDSVEDVTSAFSKPPTYPSLSTQSVLQPKSVTSPTAASGRSTPSAVMSTVPSTWQSPVTSPKPTAVKDDWGNDDMVPVAAQVQVSTASDIGKASPAASLSGMSKEEKAAEMARRREERKARIAQLKEQKKGAA